MLALAAVGAQGQQIITGDNINDFNAVTLTGRMSVEMIPADKPAVTMELHGINPKQVTWGVTGSSLDIRMKPATPRDGALIVKIYYREVQQITANGADVRIPQPLESPMFTAEISTGAKLTAVLDCKDVRLKATGNSAVLIEGRHYRMRSRDLRRPMLFSIAANALSYGIGTLL